MSKLFDMETQKAPPPSQAREEMDAEAALHIELLRTTDAKMERLNARLDHVFAELGRINQRVESGRQVVRPGVVSDRRSSPVLAACLLLLLGVSGGFLYTAWRDADVVVAPWSADAAMGRTAQATAPPEPPIPAAPTATSAPETIQPPPEAAQSAPMVDTAPVAAVVEPSPPAADPVPFVAAPPQAADEPDDTPAAAVPPQHGRIRM